MAPALYLDECIDVEVASRLRADGYDILTTGEAGLLGADDERQLQFAADHDRIFLTHNRRDFIQLARNRAAQSKPHAGIVFCSFESAATICDWLKALFETYQPSQLRDTTINLPLAAPSA